MKTTGTGDKGNKKEVSHRCKGRTTRLCIDHLELEPQSRNIHRTRHQNSKEVCNCANDGIKPYLINSTIDETNLDETGHLIGWKAIGSAEETLPTVVREVAALTMSLSRARQVGG